MSQEETVKQCYTCKCWQGDKGKVAKQLEEYPISMDRFKGWPEEGACGIYYEWATVTVKGDAIADLAVNANFGCNYWVADFK